MSDVLIFANLESFVRYGVEYYNRSVRDEIESWPVGILADYARLVELLLDFGPALRMPHSRAMGGGLFELRPHGEEGAGRALYCWATDRRGVILHAFRKRTKTSPLRDLETARKRLKKVRNG